MRVCGVLLLSGVRKSKSLVVAVLDVDGQLFADSIDGLGGYVVGSAGNTRKLNGYIHCILRIAQV